MSATAQSLKFFLKKADSLRELDNYVAAASAYEDALARSELIEKQDTTGLIYLRLGIVYGRRGMYDRSLQFYFKALTQFETINNRSNIAAVKRNIGNVYRETGKFEDAFSYAESAYIEWSKLKDSINIFYSLNDFGLIRMDQKRFDEALSYFNSVLTSTDTAKYRKIRALAITNLASVYWSKKNYTKALNYYEQIYQYRKNSGDRDGMALILLNLGGLYNDMHQYSKALNAIQEGVNLAKQVNAKYLLSSGYSYLSETYKGLGNYKKAYASAMESMAWQNSIYSDDSSQFRYAESNYLHQQEKSRREQKETENRLLNEQNNLGKKENEYNKKRIEQSKFQLRVAIIIAALIILSLLLFYKAYRTRQRNERIIEKQRRVILEGQLKESELTALRAQMNPHFIFNALSSIKNYMLEQNIQLADYYLGKFAKLIRLILDNSSQNFVSLEKELQLLESYIQLEQLRFEDKFLYKINIQDGLNTMETFIPSMIIQPFVENAIIHGFMHKEGACHLDIDIKYGQSILTVTVQDDGIGRLQSAQIKSHSGNTLHQSKGYKLSEQRLKVLSHSNYTNTGIVFKDLGNDEGKTGTLVQINIPIEQNTIS